MKFEDFDISEVGHSIQLAGAVYSDGQHAWMVLLPGKDIEAPVPVHMTTGQWNDFLQQTDLVPVEALVAGAGENGRPGIAVMRKASRQISKNVSWKVYRRDGFRCRYCGADDVPLTVDHLVTWESGGPSIEENLVAACQKCNNKRGDMPYAGWLETAYYYRVSQGLTIDVRHANRELVPTLENIPRAPIPPRKKRKRR